MSLSLLGVGTRLQAASQLRQPLPHLSLRCRTRPSLSTCWLCRVRHAKHAAYLAAAAERLIDKKREADREAERERYRAASHASSQFKTATFELSPSVSKSLSATTTPASSTSMLPAPRLATEV